jgi:hypothetical protein
MDRDIPVIDSDTPYKVFLDTFLRPLTPCLITGLTQDWPAAKQWTTFDPRTQTLVPNFSTLNSLYGHCTGTITHCSTSTPPCETLISSFLTQIASSPRPGGRYLKDFHFMSHLPPSSPEPYSVPVYFRGPLSPPVSRADVDDWFNNMCVSRKKDDFRFLYLGEDGTSTGWHHDVGKSHSWSSSLCGSP